MTVFISYARTNQAAAEQLRADVERCHRRVWVDRELTGGQSWWLAILHHIRDCDVFAVALSPQWVHSKACDLELRYAIALGRPVLPIMVAKVDPRLAPPAVADAQILDYLQRNPETMFALRDALDTLPAAPPLPALLPPEPAAPISYLHNVITALNAPALGPDIQFGVWRQLRAALDDADDDERAELLKLVRRFRRRRDLIPQLISSIDAVSGPPTSPGEQSWPPVPSSTWTAPTQIRPVPTTNAAPPPSPRPGRIAWLWAVMAAVAVALVVWIAVTVANFGGGGTGSGQRASTPATTTTMTSEAPGPAGGDPGPGHTVDTGPTEQMTFAMPDLSGRAADDAKGQLSSLGWRGSLRFGDAVEHGIVVGQDPQPGVAVAVDATVTVTLMDDSTSLPSTTTTEPT
jgi:hypothetical protein